MSKLQELEHKALLYAALDAEYGVVVETSDAERLRQKLYAIRKEDLEVFASLSFILSPFNSDLWIVKQRNKSP